MGSASRQRWTVAVPIRGGEAVLEVPDGLGEPALNREIAVQDLTGRRLLQLIHRLENAAGSNLELVVCPESKLETTAAEFLAIGRELRRFFIDFAGYHSVVPELARAREDVSSLVRASLLGEVERIESLRRQTFGRAAMDSPARRGRLDRFRKELAKSLGMVSTELKKILAHLFTYDPRNLYRPQGPRPQHEILFRQFRRDVEETERLYTAVRRLDAYVRGAIIATDLLGVTVERILREESLACLFELDYSLFLNALFDEIGECLIPELEGILSLDGIWYDDYESLRKKARMIARLATAFKAAYLERGELREEVRRRAEGAGGSARCRPLVAQLLAVLDTHGHREVAARLRGIDQVLVDLEGMLVQWQRGIAMRAFADASWKEDDPAAGRRSKNVILAP